MTTLRELKGEDRFVFTRQLSDTLQGRIYAATDNKTGKHVVVKETWKELMRQCKSRSGHNVPENCEREVRILKYLSKQPDAPHTFVRIIEEWEDTLCHLFAMEMCTGGELFDYIQKRHESVATKTSRNKPQTDEWMSTVQRMFKQMVSCIAFMHSKRVCHLDLSLENVMITSALNHDIKLIDFGAAQYYPPTRDGAFTDNRCIGKRFYMAPEVFMKKTYDPRAADIWSLGVMLFMMLIGAKPFESPDASNAAFHYIVNGRLKDVLKAWSRLQCVNEDTLDLLNRILTYEPQRITMEEMLKHPFINSDLIGHTNK